MAPTEEMNLVDFDRSNKGASKQRRDLINAEIAIMRDLLPLAESARQRLSQLQIMSLTCVYIRKCNVLQKLFRSKCPDAHLPDTLDFFQALTGFLLVTTREGKLLYISENVTDFLGHSMVDMKTQGDSLYDIVDSRDQNAVSAQLMQSGSPDGKEPQDVSFFCRMNMSRTLKRQSGFGDVKVMHVRGHFIQVSNNEPGCAPGDTQSVFMATCSPLITPDLKENLVQNNTMVFKTVHHLDMTFVEVTKTAEHHLGQTNEELFKTSWYSLLHPEDIHEAKEKHIQLIRSNHEMGCMMTVRMLKPDGTHFWVNLVMHVRQASLMQNDEPMIVCINQVIDAQEAYQIKMRGHMFSMYPGHNNDLWRSQVPPATPQDIAVNPWIHQGSAHTLPMSGYAGSMQGYTNQQGRPPVYHLPYSPEMAMARGGKPIVGLPAFSPANMVQSDKLKAMLKRKIQGPPSGSCRPSKMAKVTWDMKGNNGGHGYSDQSMPMMEKFAHMPMPACMESQGQSVQVMQPGNYRIGVMMARKSQEVLNCHGMSMPVLTKTEMVMPEQVVPDVNVPDSFLTPDPSPVSSPQPSKVFVKTEVMDPEETGTTNAKSSVSILQALEKLATLPQQPKAQKPVLSSGELAKRRKELPIFDAFDIDNFFDNLEGPVFDSKASVKVEADSPDCIIKKEVQDESHYINNIPDFGALKEEKCLSPVYSPQRYQAYSPSSVISNSPVHHPQEQEQITLSMEPLTKSDKQNNYDAKPSNRVSSTSSVSKDRVVSSVMASSPKSVASPEHIDDLLSCFSDDGLDLSPLQMDPRSTILETSVTEDLLDDHSEKSYHSSFYNDVHCRTPMQLSNEGSLDELSPQPSSSPLAGEDDVVEDASTFTLAMALDALESPEEVCQSSIKARDVLGMTDELNFILNAF